MEAAGVVRVLIVDDDFYARDALSALVARDPRTRVWGAVGSVPAALSELRASANSLSHPDVVLLDVRLEEGERAGIEGIAAVRAAAPDARVLITSVSSDDATVQAAVQAGADGYIWKNEAAERIATAVVRAAEGRFVLSQRIAERLIDTLGDVGRYTAEVLPRGVAGIELTEAVRKTVYLFCVAGLSAREIADELQISVNTVNKRIAAAYAALGATSRSEAFQRLVEGEAS